MSHLLFNFTFAVNVSIYLLCSKDWIPFCSVERVGIVTPAGKICMNTAEYAQTEPRKLNKHINPTVFYSAQKYIEHATSL